LPVKICCFVKLAFIGWLCLISAGCSHNGILPGPSAAPEQTGQITAEPLPSPAPAPVQYSEYTVKLDVQPAERMVTGVEKIKIKNVTGNRLSKIYINAPLNAFSENPGVRPVFDEFMDKAYPGGINYGYMIFSNIYADGETAAFNLKGTVLEIDLPEALPPGESAELRLELEAKIPVMNNRTGSDGSGMWFGNFIPMLAVCDAEGWHTDPYYPAGDPFFARTSNFYVSITAPAEYTVAGPGVPVVTDNDGKRTTDFTLKLARDFAFSICSHYSVSTITSPLNVEISLYTFSTSARAGEILALASRSLGYYNGLAGAYPYSQLAIVETKLFEKGALEYPGVIFIDSDYLASSGDFASLTHEIGHQWFYNIIGSNQIENAWMDEGLNSFIQKGFALDSVGLDGKMEDEYDSLMHIISQIKPNTLNSGLGEFKSWSDYYNIHYIRGELMFYSLYKKIGKAKFNAFLTEYSQRYSYRIAAPDDLIQTAADVSGMNLSAFFSAWINDPVLPPL